ncbi:hypothetical protein [Dyadobacter sandarakinus]|uniref:Uncharacterized protein n=1 Tax=Dyadobacter sandarakinus TaxID=2747268 RepID=A0ABX7I1K0_9BACT|nr:hypothetical protein [Dyadobacter sandarakinus]QRQ99729.1 hypothetical protein HWI92_01755 [Dyadobacter sandarakinus]
MSKAMKNSVGVLCFTGLALVIIVFVLLGAMGSQAQRQPDSTKSAIPVEIKQTIQVLPDTLLPDTTQAKVALLLAKASELAEAIKQDSITAIKEATAAKKERRLAEFVSSKTPVPEIQAPELKSTHTPFPDTLIIIHKIQTKKKRNRR